MPQPYKGYSFQRTKQQKYAQPRHQPSDRDQETQQRLKVKLNAVQNTFNNNTPKPIIHPPKHQNKEAHATTLQQLQDPTLRYLTPSNISELDFCTAFHSMNI